uniref:Uncharacterized protein n=1 Tax=Vitis vinifera TaxID=29760 RepID=F6HRN4_VITVI
MEKGTKGFYD